MLTGALKSKPGARMVSEKSGGLGAFGVSDGALVKPVSPSGADNKIGCPPLAILWATAGETPAATVMASSNRHLRCAKLEPISSHSLFALTAPVKNEFNPFLLFCRLYPKQVISELLTGQRAFQLTSFLL
jgi:hypothetical protein